jgi:hypothetical protein
VSPDRRFLLDRVPVPAWLHGIDELDVMSNFGEQMEWGFAIPWIYQALAEPLGNRPMLQPPGRGDDFWPGALAYWSSLLHLLVYGFGWSRPDRGLRWWYHTGKPTNDAKLALLSEVWDADGQLDWFAAWLWTSGNRGYLNRPSDAPDETQVAFDPEWLRHVEGSIKDSERPHRMAADTTRSISPLISTARCNPHLQRPTGTRLTQMRTPPFCLSTR